MNAQSLLKAIDSKTKPEFSNETERCLWLAGVDEWDKAHNIVESLPEPNASWIHAALHREEGDLGNAEYWYSRANKKMPANGVTFQDELRDIIREIVQ